MADWEAYGAMDAGGPDWNWATQNHLASSHTMLLKLKLWIFA